VEPGGVSPFGSPTNSRCQGASGHHSISRAWPPSASAPVRYSTSSPSPAIQNRSARSRLRLGRAMRRWLDGSARMRSVSLTPEAVPLAHRRVRRCLCCQAAVPRLWLVRCQPQCGRLPSTSCRSVLLGEAQGREDLAAPAVHLRVGGYGGDSAADVARGLRGGEVRVLLDGVPPGGLGDSETVEHRLRAQEPGCQGQGGEAV